MKNNNKQIISKISRRSMKQNRFRNVFAVIAIILTSILFTVTFTLTMGIIESIESETMRQVGTKAHGGYKDLTKEQYEKLSQNENIVDYSYNILFGTASNEEFIKHLVELRYTDEKNFEWSMMELTEGRLPQKKNEIVLDTLALDALGAEHKLGEEVTISYDILDESHSDTFTLCGYYEGDILLGASEAYFSKEYVEDVISIRTEQEWAELNLSAATNGIGLIQMNIYLDSPVDIEGKMLKVIEQCGYAEGEIDYGVNWGYASSNFSKLDPFSIIMIAVVLFIIAAAGYLMIYNIFYISIVNDIRFFGLLKTIGTTKKQIKTLIKKQADLLSLIGISIGVVLGWLLGNAFMPLAIAQLSGNVKVKMAVSPYIFIFGIIFSYITVFISCRKPGKIAASISPIEAAKYQDNNTGKKSKHNKNNKAVKRHNKRFSYFRMALRNIGRNKKKTIFVIASMSLGLILLLEVFTVISSFSSDKYVSAMLGGTDLYMSSASMQSRYEAIEVGDNIKGFKEYLGGDKALKDMGVTASDLYLGETQMGVTGEAFDKYKEIYDKGIIRSFDERDDDTKESIEKTLRGERGIRLTLYGWDYDILKNVKVTEGEIDKEKYNSGKYIVLLAESEEESFKFNMAPLLYKVGDKLTVNDTEYEVMAYVEMPYRISKMSYSYNGMFGIMPEKEAEKNCVNYYIQYGTAFNTDNLEQLESKAEEFTQKVDISMVYYSHDIIANELSSVENMIKIIGGALSLFVALIAIMNFVNSIITGIITRKKEFAMLKSIGMEREQLLKMLYVESMSYVLITYVITLIIGSLVSVLCIRPFSSAMAWLEYNFTLIPVIICLPVLVFIGFLIPYAVYSKSCKESVVELLREE